MILLGPVGQSDNHSVIALFVAQIADEALGAVDDIVIPVCHSGGLQGTGIGTCTGLGQSEGTQHTGHSSGEVFLLLCLVAELHDDIVHQQVYGIGLGGAGAGFGQLGYGNDLAAVRRTPWECSGPSSPALPA